MIRTVIQQRESFTITLPKKWVQKHSLVNKDPLHIDENVFSGELVISPVQTSKKTVPEITIEANDMTYRNIAALVNQNYRLGYDIIRAFSVAEDIQNDVAKLADQMLGFTATKNKNSIIFEALTQETYNAEQVQPLLRKLFFIIKETYSAKQTELDELQDRMDLNTNYLRRIIIKYNHEGKLAYFYYDFLGRLSLAQHAICRAKKLSKGSQTKDLFDRCSDLFSTLETGFFKKDLHVLSQVDTEKKAFDKECTKHLKKYPEDYMQYFYELVRMIQLAVLPAQAIIMTS